MTSEAALVHPWQGCWSGSPPLLLLNGKGGLLLSINRSSDIWLANAALPASRGLNASRFLISGLV